MIVVTGWPRSGTSLLMQLLIAGGLNPIHDGGDVPRAGNPGGIWEEPTAFHRPEWVIATHHRDERACLKVLYRPLLRVMGMGFPIAAVIYSDRRPEASLASQARIAGPRDRLPDAAGLAHLKKSTLSALDEFEVPHLEIPLRGLVDEPRATVDSVAGFLSDRLPVTLDRAAMAAVPDPSLLHH